MAIAIDATSSGGTAGNQTSLTVSHTCTGSNLILWLYIFNNNGDNITGVTYNGVAMTQLSKRAAEASTYLYLYYLVAPATGTHDIVASASNSTYALAAASYTGASQTGVPDSGPVGSGPTAAQTSLTLSTTVVAANSWLIGTYRNDASISTAGSNTFIRVYDAGNGSAVVLIDSNSAQAAGSRSMTTTFSSANATGIIASFAPVAITNSNFLAFM